MIPGVSIINPPEGSVKHFRVGGCMFTGEMICRDMMAVFRLRPGQSRLIRLVFPTPEFPAMAVYFPSNMIGQVLRYLFVVSTEISMTLYPANSYILLTSPHHASFSASYRSILLITNMAWYVVGFSRNQKPVYKFQRGFRRFKGDHQQNLIKVGCQNLGFFGQIGCPADDVILPVLYFGNDPVWMPVFSKITSSPTATGLVFFIPRILKLPLSLQLISGHHQLLPYASFL